MAQANVKLTVDARGATKALQDVNNKTNQLQKSFGGLKTAIAGIGIGLLARNTVKTTANFQALQIRMKVLTSEFGEFAQVQNLVTKAQNQFNLSIVEATQGITDIFARLRPLGVSLKDIETTFIGFNSIAKVAGLNATEASAAFTQLAQGLGSGRLQGDEFRSIAEQVPQLLKAISDETGIASGKLKDFASKGLLKSDIIIRALSKSAKGLGKQIKDIIDESPAEKFKALNNELLELQLTLGSKLTPALADGAVALASFVETFTKFIDSDAGQTALVLTGIALAAKGLTAVSAILSGALTVLIAKFKLTSAGAIAMSKAQNTAALSTKALAIASGGLAVAMNALPLVALAGGFVFLTNSIIKAINKQKEFNELLEEGSSKDIQQRIEATTKTIEDLEKKIKDIKEGQKGFQLISGAEGLEADLKKANDELTKLENRLVITQGIELSREFQKTKDALIEKNKELKKSLERSKIATEEGKKQFDQEQRRIELTEKYGEELANIILKLEKENQELEKGAEKIKKKQEETDKLKEKMAAVGEEIESSIKNNLRDAITGAKSFGEAMSGVLNKIRDKLLDLVIDQAIGGIGGFFSKAIGGLFGVKSVKPKALGGPVESNKTFLVGERGPELFVPRSAGNIIPNNEIVGGQSVINNITVNVDASGSSVQSDGDGQQFGEALATAIQLEIAKQKRSGGLLA